MLDPSGHSPLDILTCAYESLQGLMAAAAANAATNLFNCDIFAQDCAGASRLDPFQIGSCEKCPAPLWRPSTRKMDFQLELDWDKPSVAGALVRLREVPCKRAWEPAACQSCYVGLTAKYWCVRDGCVHCHP